MNRWSMISGVLVLLAAASSTGWSQSGKPVADKKKSMNVGVFVYEGMEILDFGGPAEVFAAAGNFSDKAEFNVYTVGSTKESILSQGFIRITPEFSIADCPKPDIIVFPGGNSANVTQDEATMKWLAAESPDLKIAMSVCTGAFVLAKAGLLDEKKATTWYGAIGRLREASPKTTVLEKTRFVDNGNVITTAGVSAGIDGALHVVATLLGDEAAQNTARYMEYDKWKPNRGLVVSRKGK